jgi:transposase
MSRPPNGTSAAFRSWPLAANSRWASRPFADGCEPTSFPDVNRQPGGVRRWYLDDRWEAGCHNSTLLFDGIRALGYKGSRQRVTSFVASWRQTGGRVPTGSGPRRVAPKHAAFLMAQAPDKFTPEQQKLFDRLTECCPDLLPLRKIALAFRDVFATADAVALFGWIQEIKRSRFGPLVRFAYGLQKDIVAVTAAVETEWSNGQTEGQINRLKAIKRPMYGRAGFAQLRARVLPSPVLTTSASVNSS